MAMEKTLPNPDLPFYDPSIGESDTDLPALDVDTRGTNVVERLPGETLEELRERLGEGLDR